VGDSDLARREADATGETEVDRRSVTDRVTEVTLPLTRSGGGTSVPLLRFAFDKSSDACFAWMHGR